MSTERDELGYERTTFHDDLYEWLRRTPWLLVSTAAHLIAFFVLAAVPWHYLKEPDRGPILETRNIAPPEEIVDEPPVELPPEPVDQPPDDVELIDDVNDEPAIEEAPSDTASDAPPSPFHALSDSLNPEIGVGGGAGPKGPKGGVRNGRGRPSGGRKTERALAAGLEWLARHQSDEGSWAADAFDEECGELGATLCDGAGYAEFDVGITGLALLAFLGAGSSTRGGEYQDTVQRGIAWLQKRQDPDSGLVGERASREFVYNHALATLALCENYYYSRSPRHARTSQRALDFIGVNRNPYSGWRYDVPPAGESDTSVTGWMVFALAAGRDAGLDVDESAFDGALAWLDEVSDPSNGRVGYTSFGSASSRVVGVNDHFPKESGEAMTAVGLLSRVFLGQEPRQDPMLEQHADLLLRSLPSGDAAEYETDHYYWYYGTYAMFQMGAHEPEYWRKWERTLEPAVLSTQRTDGDEVGSWDPIGPWGFAGGRVYSTALMTLSLEVYFRYGKLLGDR